MGYIRRNRGMLILLGLAGLLAVQLALRSSISSVPAPPYRLTSGERLTEPLRVALSDAMAAGCRVVYFANPGCPGCRALAESREWIDDPAHLWIIEGRAQEVAAFAARSSIPEGSVFALERIQDLVNPTLSTLGIFATPTSAILAPDGTLWKVRVPVSPRSTIEAPEACDG